MLLVQLYPGASVPVLPLSIGVTAGVRNARHGCPWLLEGMHLTITARRPASSLNACARHESAQHHFVFPSTPFSKPEVFHIKALWSLNDLPAAVPMRTACLPSQLQRPLLFLCTNNRCRLTILIFFYSEGWQEVVTAFDCAAVLVPTDAAGCTHNRAHRLISSHEGPGSLLGAAVGSAAHCTLTA